MSFNICVVIVIYTKLRIGLHRRSSAIAERPAQRSVSVDNNVVLLLYK